MRKFLLCLLLLPSLANSQFFSGSLLKQYCSGNPVEKMYCRGYVTATVDVATRSELQSLFCLPKQEMEIQQVIDVVRKFLDNHPEQLHHHPTVLILTSLGVSFPCKK